MDTDFTETKETKRQKDGGRKMCTACVKPEVGVAVAGSGSYKTTAHRAQFFRQNTCFHIIPSLK
jgi:hypothetical protein